MTIRRIEEEFEVKANDAPRVTPADIEANIASEFYFTAAQGAEFGLLEQGEEFFEIPKELDLLTICVIVLKNGFCVTGESACVSAENFDAEVGRKLARLNATDKIWPLMGYALKLWMKK